MVLFVILYYLVVMSIILCCLMALVASSTCLPVDQNVIPTKATRVESDSEYLLSNYVTTPTFYDLRLYINPNNDISFFGNVTIRILTIEETNVIVMHANELSIETIAVYADFDRETDLFESFTLANDDTHFLTIVTSVNLTVSTPYVVDITFTGYYAEDMFGMYVSSYTVIGSTETRNLVTTQMQPTYARRVFPCYDEPLYKAVFRTTIYAPAEYTTVVSNTAEVTGAGSWPDVINHERHQFEDTVVMSTYLIALLVSDFAYVSNDDNMLYGSPFKVYSRPGTQDFAEFALEVGQKNLAALENYTGVDYALSKMDKAAIPDFAAGAMENWGLVTYREAALLVQDGVTTTSTKQSIARIIGHENVHQWFGNEISPVWWNYLWLNEGFASLYESISTDMVLPEYRLMDQFIVSMQSAFQTDSTPYINAMSNPVYSPTEVMGNFNTIAYQKSASVLRMIQHSLTPEIFRQGLTNYLNSNAKSAVRPSDLHLGLEQAIFEANYVTPYSISLIMSSWEDQAGFPVVHIRRQATNANSLSIRQERYFTDITHGTNSNEAWYIPINWALSSNPDFNTTTAGFWLPPTLITQSVDVQELSNSEWYIINKQQTGYYRVNYDDDNWLSLSRVLNSDNYQDIHLLNRAQIVDDAFNLARTKYIEYDTLFGIVNYLRRELDYIPWASANSGITYLNNVLSGSEYYNLFQKFIITLTEPLYESLGFIASDSEEHVTAFHRNIILNYNCRFGNENCTNTAQELLQRFIANEANGINPDIQSLVYCSSLRVGNPNDFDFLWNRYLTTSDSTEEVILLNSLGCTSNDEKLQFLFDQVISTSSLVREQDRHTILVAAINSGPDNVEKAFEFIKENFLSIQQNVQGLSGTRNILTALSNALTTEEHLDELNGFIERYQDSFTAAEISVTSAAVANLQATRVWVEANVEIINTWLRDNVPSSSAGLKSCLLLIIQCILFVYFY